MRKYWKETQFCSWIRLALRSENTLDRDSSGAIMTCLREKLRFLDKLIPWSTNLGCLTLHTFRGSISTWCQWDALIGWLTGLDLPRSWWTGGTSVSSRRQFRQGWQVVTGLRTRQQNSRKVVCDSRRPRCDAVAELQAWYYLSWPLGAKRLTARGCGKLARRDVTRMERSGTEQWRKRTKLNLELPNNQCKQAAATALQGEKKVSKRRNSDNTCLRGLQHEKNPLLAL